MSILGSIFSKILGHHGAAPAGPSASNAPGPTPSSGPAAAPPSPGTSTPVAPAPDAPPPQATTSPPSRPAPAQPPQMSSTPAQPVDVAAILDGLGAKSGQTLDWKHSIVDMMKLLGLDSSLSARQALAKELNYTGDMHDSATMNIWLHKQVMDKLAKNGGKVPDDLRR
ncbi:MAG TPA: DUF3597 domain-containing protein [Lichenihabitans sp.]|nr:DUF3597 domain-containing protein [Lichenihabitans sp.]